MSKGGASAERSPSAQVRAETNDRSIALLIKNARALAQAVSSDFGWRPVDVTGITDGAGMGSDYGIAGLHAFSHNKAVCHQLKTDFGPL